VHNLLMPPIEPDINLGGEGSTRDTSEEEHVWDSWQREGRAAISAMDARCHSKGCHRATRLQENGMHIDSEPAG
jgi:hypothetical protein